MQNLFIFIFKFQSIDVHVAAYEKVGCFKDTSERAIPSLEDKDAILDGCSYDKRENATEKCASAASKRGFQMFAVQNGGLCSSSATAQNTYNKYGPSNECKDDGKGSLWANQVYAFQGLYNVF